MHGHGAQPIGDRPQPGHSASGRKFSTLAAVTTPPSGSVASGSTPGAGVAGPDGLDEGLGTLATLGRGHLHDRPEALAGLDALEGDRAAAVADEADLVLDVLDRGHGARDRLVGAHDDRDVRVSRDDVLGGLQAGGRRVERLAGVGHDLDLGMRGDGLIERLLEGDVEGGGLDRPDVADVARVVGLESAHAVTTRLPIFLPSSLGTNATFELRPSTCESGVVMSAPRTWSMLPTLMPAAMAFLTSSTMPAPYSGWVMIASYLPEATASWSCLTCSVRIQVRVEDGQVGVAGGRGGLGRCEHRGVVAVGDRERQIGDLEQLVVDARGGRGARRGTRGGGRRRDAGGRRWRGRRGPAAAGGDQETADGEQPGQSPQADPACRISAHVTPPPQRRSIPHDPGSV